MSDDRRVPEDLTEADDHALGAALRSAIGKQVETPAARPPVSAIAQRAAAQARARHTRQAVVGIAASLALVAGGFAAWNALDNPEPSEVIVVDQPTTSPESPHSSEPAAVPTSVPTAIPTADPVGQLQQADDAPPASSQISSEPITPEVISTGPVLQWAELDASAAFGSNVIDAHNVVSLGDGRVLVEAYGDDGNQVLVTDNGADWTVIPMPADFDPERFDLADERWLVTGWDTTSLDNAISAFYSDNQGATWSQLSLNLEGPDETSSVAAAAVSGENMVIAVETRFHPDIASVIVARGLVPTRDSIKGWMSVQGYTVSFTQDESSEPESFQLTPEEEEMLYGGDRDFVRLFHSSGGDPVLAAEYAAWEVGGYGADDGFHLLMLGAQEEMHLTSSDGRQWSEARLTTGDGVPAGRFYTYYGTTEATVWISGQSGSGYRVPRFDGAYAPALVADLPNGIGRVDRFSVGPAGVAMIAVPGRVPDADVMPTFQVPKNGYELRYNEPIGGITLWDLTEDAAVYVFDAPTAQSSMVPEGIREVDGGDDGADTLEFYDPDTGELLVAFTMDELEPWIDDPSFLATADVVPEQLEQWVGWSADGIAWDWHTLSEAFGLTELSSIEKEFINADLAVGRDFVIARVQPYQVDPSDSSSDDGLTLTGEPALWFIATVQ